ncbi:MAG: hypothetical protein U0L79_07755 [Lachnospiraceae bacterium]|nr:hypothetical protein [Lachnospiraceae bacterium]
MLKDILDIEEITLSQLSEKANIPYSTLENIYLNKINISVISPIVIEKLALYFDTTVEIMNKRLAFPKRNSFSWFKSQICHYLKFEGDIPFVLDIVKKDYITALWENKWYPESLYLLAIIDILSKKYKVPLCNKYNFQRTQKLATPLYPSDIICKCLVMNDESYKNEILKVCNKEFLKYNIIEGDIYDIQ